MGTQLIGSEDLPEIPSEFLEPYLKRFMMMQLESVHYRMKTPEELRIELKGVDHFASAFGSIHSRYAVSKEYYRLTKLTDKQILNISDEVFKEAVENY